MAFASKVAIGLFLLSICALCQASSKGDTVTERILHGFEDVTAMSDDLRAAAEKISLFSAPQQGFIIADGFTTIIGKISHGIEKMIGLTSGALPDSDAVLVVQALTTFVQVHQALLNVVIGKRGLLTMVPFSEPIRLSLVSQEAVIDTFAFNLIALIPTQQPAAEVQFRSLSVTLTQAEDTYSSVFQSSESDELTYTTTERILQGLQNVTALSDSLRIATLKINFVNAGQQGYIIAQGFTTIIAKIAEGTLRVESVSTGALDDADAVLVVEALTKFVQVHQALLNVVIGKHGLLTLVPFFEPIRIALVNLEAVIDTFAFDLIDLIPTQKPAADAQFSSLSITLSQAQTTYSNQLLPTKYEFSAVSDVTYTSTERILQGFQTVTAMSDNLRVSVQTITIFNAGQQGFIIAEGFTAIISKISEGITRTEKVSDGPLSDDDAVLVVKALTTFVQVHQALLNVVIGKHGLLTLVPFFEPIRVALVSLEAVIDSLAYDLIGLIPTQQPAADAQFSSLSGTLGLSISTYGSSFVAAQSGVTYSTTDKILQGFQTVTAMSDNLRVSVQTITIFNAGQQGFIIAEGFTAIISKISEGITRTEKVSDGPLSDDDAVLVVKALTTFVQVHQALLNVVIGKHGLLTLVPFFEPIRVALVSLEAVIDSLAYDLIGLIPTQQPAADAQFSSLSGTLGLSISTYGSSFVAAQSGVTYSTTDKILQGFQTVTAMSDNLRVSVQTITIFNAGQQGFIIAEGFTAIISKISEGITRTEKVSDGPLSDDDAVLVVKALTTFVQVHQALLNVVIGKHGLLTLVPFFEPIRVALVSLEAVIDSLAYDLIGLIPTQQPAADAQFSSLSGTLDLSISTYGGSFVAAEPKLLAESDLTYTSTERILQGFATVTTLSDNLRISTLNINLYNAAQQGYIIAQGFTAIIAKISEGVTRTEKVSDGPLSDDDAVLVVEALTKFVQVHQALLNVVIGKHGLLTLVPFFEPIRVALVNLEAVIDTFAFDLIGLIPTQKPAADAQFASLSITLTATKNTYSTTFLSTASKVSTKFEASTVSTDVTYTATERILQGFETVTAMSDSLRIATLKINLVNAAQQGIIISQGFTSIIAKISEGVTRTEKVSTGPLDDADAVLVVEALTTFVQVHQALLNVVIGKHGLLTLVPFFEPIRIALVNLEIVIDTFAYDLIALIPTQEPAAQGQFSSLSITLKQAQGTYSSTYLKSVAEY